MNSLWNDLAVTDRPIVLYGMGDGADKMLAVLEALGKTPAAVFASDDFVRGQSFRGYKVQKYSEVKALFPDMIVLVSFGSQLPDVIENVKRIALQSTLFAPDLPVYGDGLFDIDFCKKHRYDIEFIYSRLADGHSRNAFECVVRYKLTGDVGYLFKCETTPDEAYKNILRLSDEEIYFDLGAYRGDTVAEFLRYVSSYKKIYALEPDKKNFAKLFEAYGDTAVCLNAAASDSVGQVFFDTKKGRNSHVSTAGRQVEALTVDSLATDGASYIKFDVEGNEKDALAGAKQTIARYKPKLNVAAYHRAFDLVSIPLQVLSINPDYKMYLRHFPYIPAWDTNYYFV